MTRFCAPLCVQYSVVCAAQQHVERDDVAVHHPEEEAEAARLQGGLDDERGHGR